VAVVELVNNIVNVVVEEDHGAKDGAEDKAKDGAEDEAEDDWVESINKKLFDRNIDLRSNAKIKN